MAAAPLARKFIRLAPLSGPALEAAFEFDPASLATAYWDVPSEVADRLVDALVSAPLATFDPPTLVARLSPAGLSHLVATSNRMPLLLAATDRYTNSSELRRSCDPDFCDNLLRSASLEAAVVERLWRAGLSLSAETVVWAESQIFPTPTETPFFLAALGRHTTPPRTLISLLVQTTTATPSAAARTALAQVVRDAPLAAVLSAEPNLADAEGAFHLLRTLAYAPGLAASQALRALIDYAPSSRFLAPRISSTLVAALVSNPGAAPRVSTELASRFDLTLPTGYSTSDRVFFDLMSLPLSKPLPSAFAHLNPDQAALLRRCLLAFLRTSQDNAQPGRPLVPEQADTGLRFLRLLDALLPEQAGIWRQRLGPAFSSAPADELPLLASFGITPSQRWGPTRRKTQPVGFRKLDHRQVAASYREIAPRLTSKEEWLLFFGLLQKGLSISDAALIAAD